MIFESFFLSINKMKAVILVTFALLNMAFATATPMVNYIQKDHGDHDDFALSAPVHGGQVNMPQLCAAELARVEGEFQEWVSGFPVGTIDDLCVPDYVCEIEHPDPGCGQQSGQKGHGGHKGGSCSKGQKGHGGHKGHKGGHVPAEPTCKCTWTPPCEESAPPFGLPDANCQEKVCVPPEGVEVETKECSWETAWKVDVTTTSEDCDGPKSVYDWETCDCVCPPRTKEFCEFPWVDVQDECRWKCDPSGKADQACTDKGGKWVESDATTCLKDKDGCRCECPTEAPPCATVTDCTCTPKSLPRTTECYNLMCVNEGGVWSWGSEHVGCPDGHTELTTPGADGSCCEAPCVPQQGQQGQCSKGSKGQYGHKGHGQHHGSKEQGHGQKGQNHGFKLAGSPPVPVVEKPMKPALITPDVVEDMCAEYNARWGAHSDETWSEGDDRELVQPFVSKRVSGSDLMFASVHTAAEDGVHAAAETFSFCDSTGKELDVESVNKTEHGDFVVTLKDEDPVDSNVTDVNTTTPVDNTTATIDPAPVDNTTAPVEPEPKPDHSKMYKPLGQWHFGRLGCVKHRQVASAGWTNDDSKHVDYKAKMTVLVEKYREHNKTEFCETYPVFCNGGADRQISLDRLCSLTPTKSWLVYCGRDYMTFDKNRQPRECRRGRVPRRVVRGDRSKDGKDGESWTQRVGDDVSDALKDVDSWLERFSKGVGNFFANIFNWGADYVSDEKYRTDLHDRRPDHGEL